LGHFSPNFVHPNSIINLTTHPDRPMHRLLIATIALPALAAPAYADNAAYLRQMRSLYPNGTDANLLAVGNWACDRNPAETFDELYEGLSQTHSASAAQSFAYNVTHAAHEALCPPIVITGNILLVGDEIILRKTPSINSEIVFRTSGRVTAIGSTREGNWFGAYIRSAEGDRFGYVYKDQVRLGIGD